MRNLTNQLHKPSLRINSGINENQLKMCLVAFQFIARQTDRLMWKRTLLYDI